MRIRSYLFMAAAVILVPGFLAAAISIDKVREGERHAAIQGLRETVRATSLLVDGEVQRSIGALSGLATSNFLKQGDLAAFYSQAQTINQPPDVWTLLFDERGQQLVNTAVPWGTRLPMANSQARIAKALALQTPYMSDLAMGTVSGKLLTTVYLPVKMDDGRRYVLAQAFAVGHWKRSTLQPQGRTDWTVGVVDHQGNFIARSVNADERLGKPARPELVAAAAKANEGLIRHKTLEGAESYDAFTHSKLTGWTIAVAAPVASIESSATQAVTWLMAGAATALALATAVAWLAGRKLMDAIETASDAARSIGRGELPAMPSDTSLHEVNDLNQALKHASQLLTDERQSRELLEADRTRLLLRETAAREAAQAQNAAKDQFLALLGHELRNPLAAIAGATAVLTLRKPDAATSERFLKMIERQNRHLTRIIDDLLDVSRMLSGRIVLEKIALNMADCVRNCVDALATQERSVGHTFAMNVEEVWIDGDAVRIEQILNNLLINALKYSPTGSTISVRLAAIDDEAVLSVHDNGLGMPADLLPHVFEAFVQGPPMVGQVQSGLGIGLALVKQLVELHGGQVRAHSEGEGQGSLFTVTLPAIAPPPASGHSDAAIVKAAITPLSKAS